jgi:hypothetical protein
MSLFSFVKKSIKTAIKSVSSGVVVGLVLLSSTSIDSTKEINLSQRDDQPSLAKFSPVQRASITPSYQAKANLPKVHISFFGQPAQAANTRKFEVNGIALNANMSGAWGYKHGAPLASQYSSTNGDLEQEFETISAPNNSQLIKNPNSGLCLNSYQTTQGSSPNWMPCDINDQDQQFKIEGNGIIHSSTGLKLNLGAANNTVLIFQQNNPNREVLPSNPDKGYNGGGGSWGDTPEVNLCPEIENFTVQADGGTAIYHLNQCGKTYIYLNPRAAKDLAYDLKNIRTTTTSIGSAIGFSKVSEVTKRLVSGSVTFASAILVANYGLASDSAINGLEYCADKDKSMWLDSSGGYLFTLPKVTCDK